MAAGTNRLLYTQWLQTLSEKPWRTDFYQALRHVESAHPQLPRLGQAQRHAPGKLN